MESAFELKASGKQHKIGTQECYQNSLHVVFFTLFFSVVYFLLTRWREKIRNSTPLHVLNLFKIVAIFAFVTSFIYLLGFSGIDFVQSILRPSTDLWPKEDEINDAQNTEEITLKEDSRKVPCLTFSIISELFAGIFSYLFPVTPALIGNALLITT
ncbi:hypothetical protein CMV_022324 [Castanea mollissima]|uniref:Uncharacterized protein n=1 Tax=Castanea mollissima TaxID=60419 RepID=A0A8J4QE21_9ROSI|nr:hypothetical protein CMV_022324 [Castanea mollissima]